MKLYAAEGDTVAVGAPLAEIALGEQRARNGQRRTARGSAADAPAEAASRPAARSSTSSLPAGSESVTEGTILEWSVKVGDTVKDGDTVVEISTDKVDMELPAPAAGTITEILVRGGRRPSASAR